jgi:superfamily II RNA helicase
MRLVDALPNPVSADGLFDAFTAWTAGQGLGLYAHQEEAAIELFDGANVVLATPTGSGKSLVAVAAHFAAMSEGRTTYYTAPIKALVSEKFFALCATFGAEHVGMVTGDAAVNADAPIVCCTAEVLANIALRGGASAPVGQVVMDEFHFYADGQRGWAWQVPLLCLPQAQFLLMSATLGDVGAIATDLTERTGRETAVIADAQRPVPLTYAWSTEPLHELLEELVGADQAPIYVVHFTQAAAMERAQALLSAKLCTREERDAIADAIGGFRFTAGFGRTLSKLVRSGVGVHHAGMLPRYRRLVEQLAQTGLLKVICGTDTLGVGINVPIRTVVFTGLAKFDGTRHRLLKAREFHQIAGRAGRAGFDTSGHVVVQAPEHVIERTRALAKAGDDPKKRRKVQTRKPPDGEVSWTEETFERLRHATPEALVSRMRVDHAMILNVVAQPADPIATMRALTEDNHEDERGRRRLSEQAQALGDELLQAGILEWLPEPDPDGRTLRLAVELQDDFALNQPLASFALAAFALLDPESEHPALDVLSVVEAILDDPGPVLSAQLNEARREAVAAMKADGIEYDERMELLEEVSYPQPLGESLREAFHAYRETHPWVRESDLSPKSVVREMYEEGRTFSEFVAHHGLARSEGLVLRYLSDAYRALRRTVPERLRDDELDELIEWLGETVRQTDSSLLDEWEALTDPDSVAAASAAAAAGAPPPPPRPITANARAFTVMVRNAMFQKVQLAARDRFDELGRLEAAAAALSDPPGRPAMTADAWEAALGAYWDEHESIGTDPQARSPQLLVVDRDPPGEGGRVWTVRQIVDDPEGHHDFAIVATVDLDASDAAGEPVIRTASFAAAGIARDGVSSP